MTQPMKDASQFYEVERREYHAQPRRPHLVTNAGDMSATFLVLQGIGEYDFVPLVKQRA